MMGDVASTTCMPGTHPCRTPLPNSTLSTPHPSSSRLALVVVIRPCRSTSVTSALRSARRWSAGRLSFLSLFPCRMANTVSGAAVVQGCATVAEPGATFGTADYGGHGHKIKTTAPRCMDCFTPCTFTLPFPPALHGDSTAIHDEHSIIPGARGASGLTIWTL